MALPPLQRKLFRDDGYGPLLKPEIIPFTQDPDSNADSVAASTAWVRNFISTATAFPVGTRLLFQQSAAPTGWVKETNTTYNNIALRLTTGTVANKTNGKAFATCMATGRTTSSTAGGGTIANATQGGSISETTAGGTVGNKALSVAMLASHRHDMPAWSSSGSNTHILSDSTGKYYTYYTSYAGSGSNHNHSFTGTEHTHTFTGSAHKHTFTGSSHSHTIDLDINYIDCIIASKS